MAVGFVCFLAGLCSHGNNHMDFVKDILKQKGLQSIASYNERIQTIILCVLEFLQQ